jgi:hypothetical protein
MILKAKKIDSESVAEFGTFLDPDNVESICLGDPEEELFYPDSMTFCFATSTLFSLSVVKVKKRPFIEHNLEYHDFTEEVVGGFTDDIVIFAGPAGKIPDISMFKAFILPKYNWVRWKRGIWHYGQYPINTSALGWCLLPPFTYLNDCVSYRLEEPIEIRI